MIRRVRYWRSMACAFAAALLGSFPLLARPPAAAQELNFPHFGGTDDASLAAVMPRFAARILSVYSDPNVARRLSYQFRLEMVAGDYARALATVRRFEQLNEHSSPSASTADLAPDELIAAAKLEELESHVPLFKAVEAQFRKQFGRLSDRDAAEAISWLDGPEQRFRSLAVSEIQKYAPGRQISLRSALDLVRFYQLYVEYRDLAPFSGALVREDDARRYRVQTAVPVKVSDGATLCITIVRRRRALERNPTALNFTIYAGLDELSKARLAAAHGYIGVVADARGKACSPDRVRPWQSEATDSYALIDWISKQPWSDGRVGMYGGSYEGFAAWAALKHVHPALKTIVAWDPAHPGLVVPMSRNVFVNGNYQWPLYVTDNKYLDDAANNDAAHWQSLNRRWYASGRPYRDIDRIDGTPNPLLQSQLRHAAFDEYWQALAPYKEDFARIHIPVLQITGYFSPGEVAALYYSTQHYAYNKAAKDYLIIGPYDHLGAQAARKPRVVGGYVIDPLAQFDTPEITYEWFDYVMKGGKKPSLLTDRINYEVMGANLWRHAPSLAAMSDRTLTLYLSNAVTGSRYRLSDRIPEASGFIEQTVDFSNRDVRTMADLWPAGVQVKDLSARSAVIFVSAPLEKQLSINGPIHGVIKAIINKKDMDPTLALYEEMPEGNFFSLGYVLERASFASDMTARRLLKPGAVESIPFSMPVVSKQLARGSRLLLELAVNKNDQSQVNYGTGNDVSDESIADAKEPLRVRWENDSVIQIPIVDSRQ